jgi:3-mercaptopyruvate sulfurtransferase SseA
MAPRASTNRSLSSLIAASASVQATPGFVLHYLLGFEKAKNYDGSWTEYGSVVGVPIEKS